MTVRQVENVLDLLEFFAERGKPASLADISQHFGWPRSSTFNVLSTLSNRGFLFEPEGRGRFYPTPRWLVLTQAISGSEPVPAPLLRITHDLAAKTGETVCVGAASGMSVVFLEVVQSSARVRYAAEVGQRIPIHATASGQAIMSQWTENQRNTILRKVVFERFGSGTPMSIEAVEDQLRAGLHRGWFRSASNYSVDLGGVSVPIVTSGRIFSLTIAAPIQRIESIMYETACLAHEVIGDHLGASFLATQVKGLLTPPANRL